MKSRKMIGVLASILAGVVLISGTALAAWTVTGRSINILSMSSFKTSIIEDYEEPEAIIPTDKVKKVVNIKNEGTVDTYVRVKITKKWGVRGSDGKLVYDETLDPEMIVIKYNTRYWKYKEEDGYWYYTDVLKPGKLTKEPLFNSFTLSEKAGNEYKKKDADIVVALESIQAEGEAMKSVWGVKPDEFGITYVSGNGADTSTGVTFTSEKKIIFSATDTDLFANFKNLTPGCARSQVVKVENTSGGKVEFFLRAEAAKQDKMSAEEKALVNDLLSKYAKIKVKNGSSVIYEGPVDGNLGSSKNTMSKDISLGVFENGSSKDLVVTLSLDPRMDNKFLDLTGKVNWLFSASGEDDELTPASSHGGTITAVSPKTGDNTDIATKVILLVGSLFVLVVAFCFVVGRKKKKGEK